MNNRALDGIAGMKNDWGELQTVSVSDTFGGAKVVTICRRGVMLFSAGFMIANKEVLDAKFLRLLFSISKSAIIFDFHASRIENSFKLSRQKRGRSALVSVARFLSKFNIEAPDLNVPNHNFKYEPIIQEIPGLGEKFVIFPKLRS